MAEPMPLLTIAIPTYNRAGYLRQNLQQLLSQWKDAPQDAVEIIVSDNCSPDATPEVVKEMSTAEMPIRYIRNQSNLGWARNFVQCFDFARGKYILMSGDDDMLVDGGMKLILGRITGKDYGIVCMQPYGFDDDFRSERPDSRDRERVFCDSGDFLIATHRYFTLTSALVLNKALLADVDSKEFLDTDLATFHLMIRAALAAKENLFVEKYLVASKRRNSYSYEYATVFVEQYWRIMDAQVKHGLRPEVIRTIERRRLFSYYPFNFLDGRILNHDDPVAAYKKLAGRFGGQLLFECWVGPILWLPRPLAILWGAFTTAVGRIAAGDLLRGLKFARAKITRAARLSAHAT